MKYSVWSVLLLPSLSFARPLTSCSLQRDCISFTVEEAPSKTCGSSSCNWKVCLKYDANLRGCQKDGSLSHACDSGNDFTGCLRNWWDNGGWDSNEIDSFNDQQSMCVFVPKGEDAKFLLKDGWGCSGSESFGAAMGSSVQCTPSTKRTCTGNRPGRECWWTVSTPPGSCAPPPPRPTQRPQPPPTKFPTKSPTPPPTPPPTKSPTPPPTASPTPKPSRSPTASPTPRPSDKPSSEPSQDPTPSPSSAPSSQPSKKPTSSPSREPTPAPSSGPSSSPSSGPSSKPSRGPTSYPTSEPTPTPTNGPTSGPSESSGPSMIPSSVPSQVPSMSSQPSLSGMPSLIPSNEPTNPPTMSARPTRSPSETPSAGPSVSNMPTGSMSPSVSPSFAPTRDPTSGPTSNPSSQPTSSPTSSPPTTPPGPSTPLNSCSLQRDCISFTVEEASSSASCGDGSCLWKVCLKLDTSLPGCQKEGAISHSCDSGDDITGCLRDTSDNGGWDSTETVPFDDLQSMCVYVPKGEEARFLLKDGGTCDGFEFFAVEDSSFAVCTPSEEKTCTGNRPGVECWWRVSTPRGDCNL